MNNAAKGVKIAFRHNFICSVSRHGLHVISNTFQDLLYNPLMSLLDLNPPSHRMVAGSIVSEPQGLFEFHDVFDVICKQRLNVVETAVNDVRKGFSDRVKNDNRVYIGVFVRSI